jgi:hypothetical protein
MSSAKLKEYLLQIAEQVTEKTQLEDIYQQLSLLADVDESEEEEAKGDVISHEDVIKKSKEWLK